MWTTYLIHMDRPVGRSMHYVGKTKNLTQRVEQHRKGKNSKGAALLAEANKRGINWSVVATWQDDTPTGEMERRLKRRKRIAPLCPSCNPRQRILDEEIPFR